MRNMCDRRRGRRFSLFLVLSTIFVLTAGWVAWFWQVQQVQHSSADAGTIIGGPSLSAANVDAILARVGSPMVGTGKVVEQVSRQANIDDAFALAVWWTETNDGAAGVGLADRNPGGVRSSAGYAVDRGNYTIYPSYSTAIADWFTILKSRYISRGLTSIYAISYPYVGTSGSGAWAGKVQALVARYRGEGTPPTPTPTSIAPTPTASQQKSESIASAHVADKTSPLPATPAAAPTPATTPISSARLRASASNVSPSQSLLMALSLLSALLLALWSVKIRRDTAIRVGNMRPTPALARYSDPITPLPALYINEFLPVLERFSPELATLAATSHVEQLPFPNAYMRATTEVEQLPFPAMEPLPAWLSSSNAPAASLPHNPLPTVGLTRRSFAPLLASSGETWAAARWDEQSASAAHRSASERTTGDLPPAWPDTAPAPGRRLQLVGAPVGKGGGLLQRYSESTR